MQYMHSTIEKWGNDYFVIRIPKIFAEKVGFSEGTPVELQLDNNTIIIHRKRYTLEKLMSRVTPENIHGKIDTACPVGREEW
ncbi:AbrB/MazE/SpoVT family DNA-binding domain-containing protein [Calderihabitans maritimus]|uniref:Transcriptional regulator/antitoxin MazE n=1 Tax=Calderihabitans maritimus TaxID=1246530 RepID=A0A1Z5HTC5_9FIRM|nr:AbrB/MazE/SpoVT family DNA-binding domain-containing protein [Calderihabitans maritimus]GAW92779.1 transcriptional regulator/antitoxin MazE [Calderihabitans maritimus]